MGNVVKWRGNTVLDVSALSVLAGAHDEDLQAVAVVGIRQDGEFYFASSYASAPDTLWLLEHFKKFLLETTA